MARPGRKPTVKSVENGEEAVEQNAKPTETNEPVADSIVAASAPKKKYKTDLHKIWTSEKAYRIKILPNSSDGTESGSVEAGPFRLGLLPEMTIRRNIPVIVPAEILSCILDCEVDMPRQNVDESRGGFSKIYNERYTRFPCQVMGEVEWTEFEDYILAERKKPTREDK